MKTLPLFIFLLSTNISANEGSWYAPYCQNCETSSSVEKAVPNTILVLGSLVEESKLMEASVQKQITNWGDFQRWLLSMPTKVPLTAKIKIENTERWKNLEEEARALLEVHQLLGTTERKLEICRTKCGDAMRVLELEDEVKKYKDIKNNLIKISPMWVSEEFNEMAEKVKNNPEFIPAQKELKKIFTDSMANFFKGSFELTTDLREINAIIDHGIKAGQPTQQIIDQIVTKHGSTLDLVLKKGLKSGHQSLCPLAAQKNSWDKAISLRGKVVKYGLIAASFYPSGGTSAATTATATKAVVSKSLLPKLAKILPDTQLARTAAGFFLSGKLMQERIYLGDKCEDELLSLKYTEGKEADWLNCLKAKKDASLNALLSIAPGTVVATIPLTAKLIGRMRSAGTSGFRVETIAKDGRMITTMDLSYENYLRSKGLGSVAGSYWDYIGKVYRKELKLPDHEVESFIKTSKAMEDRTKLIVATKGAPEGEVFDGGVAMVTSYNAKQLLPLEKSLDIRLERDGPISEIVRLRSDHDSQLMKELLKKVSDLTKMEKDLKTIYVYTSDTHLVLYRRLKIPHEVVGKPIERDVIVKIDVKAYQDAMARH
jgi:hypothetical protein